MRTIGFIIFYFCVADLEVIGVSRSGRVRKKSSKLMDFQSPDEVETAKAVKKTLIPKTPTMKTGGGIPSSSTAIHPDDSVVSLPPAISTSTFINMVTPASVNVKVEPELILHDAEESAMVSLLNISNTSAEMEQDTQLISFEEDEDDDDFLTIDTTVRKSAYMTEKSPKKKLRKDKGKTRFTAYIMWSKDVRQEMLKTNPDMDFSTMSRRLGEMWANVPSNEKYNWRRRAKRMATKLDRTAKKPVTSASGKLAPAKDVAPLPASKKEKSKFLNRNATPARARKNAAKSKTATPSKKKQEGKSATPSTPAKNISNGSKAKHSTSKHSPAPAITPGAYKVTGTGPTDVAAHLKLLGDSLFIIGQRLKEHEVLAISI